MGRLERLATRAEILGAFFVEGVTPALVGIVAGLAASFALTRVMAGLLYGVGTHDVFSFVLTPFVLLLSAAIASLVPAVRATRVDPVFSALRSE